MLNIIDRPESLWRECIRIANDPRVVASELYKSPSEHFVLAYGPVAQRNQFQALLYSAQDEFDVSIFPIQKMELFGQLPWPGRVVCHFHWLHDRTKNAETKEQADEAVRYWEKLLRRIKLNGDKIVWTVHNVMPHESIWTEQDKAIHQLMANAADAVHVMASDTAQLTEEYYSLDREKMFEVPHPSYAGAQPDQLSRAEARRQLQIAKEEFVFLSFGAIMAYKGYDRLMDAYSQLRQKAGKKTRLVIAGLPSDKELVRHITSWGRDKPDVLMDLNPVPNEKLQVYFRASDLAVFPYYRTMNSGAAMMALTFELPILGPDSGGFRDLVRRDCGISFENSSGCAALLDKMWFVLHNRVTSPTSIRKAKEALAPKSVSRLFFSRVLEMLDC